MMRKIRLWFRCWKKIATWRYVAEILLLQMEEAPQEQRQEYIKQLRMIEEKIGNCVLSILGIYPLEDWY